MQYSFEAEPKVVKTKAKYKQDENDATQGQIISEGPTTYNKLMQDKRIKFLDPVQQEEEYIKLEKERIKIENMNIQLQNFRKMKKKMTPYSIKPSPNPRIEVNLEFFLTDAKNIPAQSVTIDVQTDQLDEVVVEEVYVPKKTGIDVETQVEDYELFDFEREVTPICDVISTKIIEQSLLEIEEEEEIQNMQQFKQSYYKRREDEKHKWQTVLQRELKRVKQKNTVVEQLEDVRRSKIKGYQRVVAYNIGRGFIQNLEKNVFHHIIKSGYFQNEFNNTLQSNVMDYLADTTLEELNFIEKEEDTYSNLISINEVPTQLAEFRQENDQQFQIYQEQRVKRRFNETKGPSKIVRVMYKEPSTNPSNFVLYIQKFLEGNYKQFMKDYQEKVSNWKSQVYNGQMTEEEFANQKNQEFPMTLPSYFTAYFQSITQLGFSLAHNMYYSTLEQQQKFYLGCIAFTKDLDIIFNFNKQNAHEYNEADSFIQYKTKIRDTHLQVSDDEAIVLDFQNLPQEINYILFYACFPNLPFLTAVPENINEIQHARYSLCDYEYNFLIDQEQMSKNLKIEEMIRQQPPPDQQQDAAGGDAGGDGAGEPKQIQQNGYFFGYFLAKQAQTEQIKQSELNLPIDWRCESLKVAKSLFEGAETNKFFTDDLQQYLSTTLSIKLSAKQQQQTTQKESKLGSSLPSQNIQQSINTSKENDDEQDGSKLDDTDGSIQSKKYLPRAFALLELSEMEYLDDMFVRLLKIVEQEDPEFVKTYEHGFEFFAGNKLISKPQHIRRIHQLGDLEIRRKAPEKKEELLIQEGDGDENANREEGENQEEND